VRKDVDRLMRQRGLAGLVVFAYDRYSPPMHYMTGQRLQYGIYFRAPDGRAHIVHDPMERDQAAAAGCDHSSFPQHGLSQLIESEGHPGRAFGRLIAETCAALGMIGPIALAGDLPAAFAHALIERLRECQPGLEVDTAHPDILALARTTKDECEIRAIHHAARGAVAAVERLRGFLGSLRSDGDMLRHEDGGPVTLGLLRRLLQEEFLAHGLAEHAASIVSQGRDAGVPHNRGNDAEHLRPGVPLLVDVFPGEAGGGYYSDLTRTFCLGPAPKDLLHIYQDVHDVFRLVMSRLRLGEPCVAYQDLVCGLFEERGHATLRTNPSAEEGYVHGLGHGVGLSLHEAPRLAGSASNQQVIEPGMVITIEPGLYYPSRGVGVRIEDLVLVRPDGTFENLTPAPYELEIEIAG
jgi:Xaa-Pro aminopeptidase